MGLLAWTLVRLPMPNGEGFTNRIRQQGKKREQTPEDIPAL